MDVSPATRHVGGDGDSARPARLRDDMRLHFMEAGVEDAVLHALQLEEFGEKLRLLDGDGANQDRLAQRLMLADGLGDPAELVLGAFVEQILVVDALDIPVGRDGDDVHLVDFVELGRYGRGRAGHAAQLGIHAEIILESDGGQCLVLRLDLAAFLGLHCLMQAIGPAAAIHHAAGEFVDDDDLAILDDIIDVAAEHAHGAQRLLHMMDHLRILEIIQVAAFQQARNL